MKKGQAIWRREEKKTAENMEGEGQGRMSARGRITGVQQTTRKKERGNSIQTWLSRKD